VGAVTRRDWATDLGIIAVGLAAAILTFSTLTDLAVACGIVGSFLGVPLQMLVPVTIDAAAVVSARVWLLRTAGDAAVAYARRLTWCCIAASVLGNAGQHGMDAYGLTPVPWWVVVVVSAIPPATLGAVVHLGHLIVREPDVAPPVEVPDVEEPPAPVDDHGLSLFWQSAPPASEPVPAAPAAVAAPDRQAAAAEDVDHDKAAQLVAEGLGKVRLQRELGVTEHRAKQLIAQYRSNGHKVGTS
jgi:hypothetical protein